MGCCLQFSVRRTFSCNSNNYVTGDSNWIYLNCLPNKENCHEWNYVELMIQFVVYAIVVAKFDIDYIYTWKNLHITLFESNEKICVIATSIYALEIKKNFIHRFLYGMNRYHFVFEKKKKNPQLSTPKRMSNRKILSIIVKPRERKELMT